MCVQPVSEVRLTSMESDLQVILEFLNRLGAEAQTRGVVETKSKPARALVEVAAGRFTEAEKRKICALESMHPAWLAWIAQRIEAARFAHGQVTSNQ